LLGEHFGEVALLAGALLFYVHGQGRPAGRLMLVYGAGLLLGAIPYAKSQAAPLGVFLAMVFAFDLWHSRRDRSDGWRPLLTLALGGVSVPLLMTSVLLVAGTWQDFLKSYLAQRPSYRIGAVARPVAAVNAYLGPDMPWFLLYWLVVIIGAFACLGRISGPLPRRFRLLLCACLGYLAVAVFAVQAPQCGFRHYSFLLLHPVALLLGCTTVFGRLSSANEIVAIKATGISPMAVIAPALVLGFLLSAQKRGED